MKALDDAFIISNLNNYGMLSFYRWGDIVRAGKFMQFSRW